MQWKTISDIAEGIKRGEISVEELVGEYIDKIKDDDKKSDRINAFITLMEEEAIKRARELDRVALEKRKGSLFGVPIAIKDNINIEGVETTCASKILTGYRATYNAYVIERLKRENAIFIGKTNMDEFAMGSSNETSYYGVVRNPADRKRVPGGSSGGSAAAVAAGFCPGALGSDTGGSIRQPAAFCGVVGYKPTYGTVSRFGLVAFASSLDQIGPLANSVRDAAILYETISGHDRNDSTSMNIEMDGIVSELDKIDIKGLKVALPDEYFIEGMDNEIKDSILKLANMFEREGAIVENVRLPHTQYAVPVYYIVATSEASSNLARYDGIKYGLRVKGKNLKDIYYKTRSEGFGDEVKRRIMLGTYSLSSGYYDAYYLKALKVRTLIRQDFEKVFKKYDVILTPTSPTPAFMIGEKISDPISMYLSDIYTISVNLAGLPAISIPCANTSNGLPIGAQFIGKLLDDKRLLQIAHVAEQLIGVNK